MIRLIKYITTAGVHELSGLEELTQVLEAGSGNGKFCHKSLTVKLFYYISDDGKLYFFHDPKTLNEKCGVELVVDEEMAFFYRNVGFIVPPFTIYMDIRLVPPYSEIELRDGELHISSYFPRTGNTPIDIEEFERRLSEGIPDLKNSDNCILHGGGADSSLLMALCAQQNVPARALTCVMTGMEGEADIARAISRKFGYDNDTHICSPRRLNEIVDRYIEDNYEQVCDPAMPVLTEMLEEKNFDTIIDGQGADSLLLSLPHGKLMFLYKKWLSVIYKPVYWLLKPVNVSKTSSLGRKIYRLKKVLHSLSQNSVEDCLMTSLNFPVIKQSEYYNFVLGDLKNMFRSLDNKYRALSYFFMFRIFPVREMQKYENLTKTGINCVMPFLSHSFIEYIFSCSTSDLFDGKNVKKPVFELIERKMPGFIRKNNTHPFYVDYSQDKCDYTNTYNGKKYPVADISNFEFTTYNLKKLKSLSANDN